ncbi:F-box family protein [Trifolium medium]|uniref:F-box family protein n=1 Tax=Trifolium medium TaxID=97028 RepID=A0A392M1W6_9FABA|nr:F-box family protein [Trifolium medium]
MYQQLLAVIDEFQPADQEDSWRWRLNPQFGYTAMSAYQNLILLHRPEAVFNQLQHLVFNNISAAPSKVIAFSWQMLLDRIPTMDNLTLRGLPGGSNINCSFCNAGAETTVHLFLHCGTTANIWYEIAWWIGQPLMLPPSLSHSFSMMVGCRAGKRGKKGMMIIWHSFIWTIWQIRNNRIFNNGVIDVDESVETIKRLSWQWFIGRMQKVPASSTNGGGTQATAFSYDGALFVFRVLPVLFWLLHIVMFVAFFRWTV